MTDTIEKSDLLLKSILEDGLCIMCNDPLPDPNTNKIVSCKDCYEYAIERIDVSNG